MSAVLVAVAGGGAGAPVAAARGDVASACTAVQPVSCRLLRPALPCSDALEGHVAAVVAAEVGRTLTKCGLAEVVRRLQELKVRFPGGLAGCPVCVTGGY